MANPMTKSAIIGHLAQKTELSKKQVDDLMEQLLTLAMKEAKNVFVVPGFGRLVLANRKARMGRNPQTGEPIKIPAKRVVKFRLAKSLKDSVLGKEVKPPRGSRTGRSPTPRGRPGSCSASWARGPRRTRRCHGLGRVGRRPPRRRAAARARGARGDAARPRRGRPGVDRSRDGAPGDRPAMLAGSPAAEPRARPRASTPSSRARRGSTRSGCASASSPSPRPSCRADCAARPGLGLFGWRGGSALWSAAGPGRAAAALAAAAPAAAPGTPPLDAVARARRSRRPRRWNAAPAQAPATALRPAACPPAPCTIIGNTGDDAELWGLHVSPDLDTVCYALAGSSTSGRAGASGARRSTPSSGWRASASPPGSASATATSPPTCTAPGCSREGRGLARGDRGHRRRARRRRARAADVRPARAHAHPGAGGLARLPGVLRARQGADRGARRSSTRAPTPRRRRRACSRRIRDAGAVHRVPVQPDHLDRPDPRRARASRRRSRSTRGPRRRGEPHRRRRRGVRPRRAAHGRARGCRCRRPASPAPTRPGSTRSSSTSATPSRCGRDRRRRRRRAVAAPDPHDRPRGRDRASPRASWRPRMSGLVAAVPVKDLVNAKQRLVAVLSQPSGARWPRRCSRTCWTRWSAAGGRRPAPGHARSRGARAGRRGAASDCLTESVNRGHTEAVAFAQREADAAGRAGFLTIPGDVPCVTAGRGARPRRAPRGRRRASPSCPSLSGFGTNAALLAPPDAMPLKFGEPSFANHLEAAAGRGLDAADARAARPRPRHRRARRPAPAPRPRGATPAPGALLGRAASPPASPAG